MRTGVTAIFPRGRLSSDIAFAGWFALNGNGEMTGTTWIEESGQLESPILITNTHSVGVVRDAVLEWMIAHRPEFRWGLPVVAETYDGLLNDIDGFHVTREHAFAALDDARPGPVPEGNVGGGTGMICHGFKGGIGTASRTLDQSAGGYTIGVLVQCNYGSRHELRIAGVPVGRELKEPVMCFDTREPPTRAWLRSVPFCGDAAGSTGPAVAESLGSIIIVAATDAPLLPHQLKRVAQRTSLGIARMGGYGANDSGDIFIAFSTANGDVAGKTDVARLSMLPNDRISPILLATVQATEEAIVNALVAAETLTGADGLRVPALPHEALRQVLRRYNRLENC